MRYFHIEFGEWSGTPIVTPIEWDDVLDYLDVANSPTGSVSAELLSSGKVNQVRLQRGWVATCEGVNKIVGEKVV